MFSRFKNPRNIFRSSGLVSPSELTVLWIELRVIIIVACSRHDKSGNSMRGKRRGGGVSGGAALPNIWYLGTGYDYSQSRVSNKLLTNVRWSQQKRRRVGWCSASLPNIWYLGSVKCIKQSINNYVIWNLSNFCYTKALKRKSLLLPRIY